MKLLLPGTFVPGSKSDVELSLPGKFVGEITWLLTRKFPISLLLINCQRCLKSENEKKYLRSFHAFPTILQQIVHAVSYTHLTLPTNREV